MNQIINFIVRRPRAIISTVVALSAFFVLVAVPLTLAS